MVSTLAFILVCLSAAGLLGLCLWLWSGYRKACRLRVCHHCGHELTKFAGGRMPWCPECGGLSGPRTRWRFVGTELRRPRVVLAAGLVAAGFLLATATGPGVSWAARGGVLGGGVLLWLCEYSGGTSPEVLDALCDQDALAPMSGRDRGRLAALILSRPGGGAARKLTLAQERAMGRFAASGVLSAEQTAAYEWLVLGRSGLAFGAAPVVSSPAAASGRRDRTAPLESGRSVPAGVSVYDAVRAAGLGGSKAESAIPPGYVGLPSTLSPPRVTAAEKPKIPPRADPDKKKDEKVTW